MNIYALGLGGVPVDMIAESLTVPGVFICNLVGYGGRYSTRARDFGGDQGYGYFGSAVFEVGHFPFQYNVKPDVH